MKARLAAVKKQEVGPLPMLKGTNAARRPLTWGMSQETVSNRKCTGLNTARVASMLGSLTTKETQCMPGEHAIG